MAPRGRPRKRNTRMDAALDAMQPLGFSRKIIETTVKQLLKVYGGDEGWPFIEEGFYRLLVDSIIERVEAEQRNGDDVKDIGDSQKLVAETLNETIEPLHACADVEHTDTELPVPLTEEEANEHTIGCALPTDEGDGTKLPLSESGDGRGCNQTRIRKPYHGWIDDDDDGEEDLVELTPGPFVQEIERLLLGKIRQNERKIRWDVRPPDM